LLWCSPHLAVFGAAVAFPFVLGKNMDYFVELYAKLNGEEELVEAEEQQVVRLREILRRVGVEHADQVKIYKTLGLGPTAVGFNNNTLGGAVFIPENLLKLHEDTTDRSVDDAPRNEKWITIHDTESGELLAHFPLSQLTTERQRLVLEQTGTLLPHAIQIDWVLGHEGEPAVVVVVLASLWSCDRTRGERRRRRRRRRRRGDVVGFLCMVYLVDCVVLVSGSCLRG
jgi:hypothetical protein